MDTMGSTPKSREAFQVALVCALQEEYDAICYVFDNTWGRKVFGNASDGTYRYKTGRVAGFNVVLARSIGTGKVAMTRLTEYLRKSFTNIRLIIVVGFCAAVPGPHNDIVLGDVVISNELVQYDRGRIYDGHYKIRSANRVMAKIQEKGAAEYPPVSYAGPSAASGDQLFEATYLHRHRGPDPALPCGCSDDKTCENAEKASCVELGCDLARLVTRARLERSKKSSSSLSPNVSLDRVLPCSCSNDQACGNANEALCAKPDCDLARAVTRARLDGSEGSPPSLLPNVSLRVFVGCVGSGDTLFRSSKERDKIAGEYNILAFEMEGAGVWGRGGCIIIKGVCDYVDSHRNKTWQRFAAARAASVTKALLADMSPEEIAGMRQPHRLKNLPPPALPLPGRARSGRRPRRRRVA
ncbi:hypothetical protein RB595_003715 [Gaeumannomyces hyphopodioides]